MPPWSVSASLKEGHRPFLRQDMPKQSVIREAIVKRVLGAIGMTLAVIGIIISLANVVGIWVGSGSVRSGVASIGDGIDGRLQRVDTALDELASRLETAQG